MDMSTVKNVIFDMDGTLLDTIKDLHAALNYTLATYGFPLRSIEETRSYVGNGIVCLVERGLPEGHKELKEEASELFQRYYRAHVAVYTAPYDGIKDLLDELEKRGIRMAIASNKSQAPLEQLVEHFFCGKMSVVKGLSDGVNPKPAPDMIIAAMEALGGSREDTLFVGDSAVDVQTAINAAVTGIFCGWGFAGRERLEKIGATSIVDAPTEILEYL